MRTLIFYSIFYFILVGNEGVFAEDFGPDWNTKVIPNFNGMVQLQPRQEKPIELGQSRRVRIKLKSNQIIHINGIDSTDGLVESFSLGGSEAHGGDFEEMRVKKIGWDLLVIFKRHQHRIPFDLSFFKTTLEKLDVVIVESISLDGEEKHAVNIPSQTRWYLTQEGFEFLTNEDEESSWRVHFFLHEFLPLIEEIDSHYESSTRMMSLLATIAENSEVTYYTSTMELSVISYNEFKAIVSDPNSTDEIILENYRRAVMNYRVHCYVSTPSLWLTAIIFAPLAGIASEVSNTFTKKEDRILAGFSDNIRDAVNVPRLSCKLHFQALKLIESEAFNRDLL